MSNEVQSPVKSSGINIPNMPPLIHSNGNKPTDRKRSMFRDDTSSYAAKIMLDGETFRIWRASDEAMQYVTDWLQEVAARCGFNPQDFSVEKVMGTPAQKTYEEMQQQLWFTVVKDALHSWTLTNPDSGAPVPCVPERIENLHFDILSQLSDFIILFTRDGVGSDEFFRRKGSARPLQ